MPLSKVVIRVSGASSSPEDTLGGMKSGTVVVIGKLESFMEPIALDCSSLRTMWSSSDKLPLSSKGSSFVYSLLAPLILVVAAPTASDALVVVISGASVRVGYSYFEKVGVVEESTEN